MKHLYHGLSKELLVVQNQNMRIEFINMLYKIKNKQITPEKVIEFIEHRNFIPVLDNV